MALKTELRALCLLFERRGHLLLRAGCIWREGLQYRNFRRLLCVLLSCSAYHHHSEVERLNSSTDIGTETFLHKIPENISSEHASPLQCAGATVYSALIKTVKPGDRVGIVGIGGLGHLAIQFSAKLGYETVVFSTSAAKEAEARSFGAEEFYLLSEVEKVAKPVCRSTRNRGLPVLTTC